MHLMIDIETLGTTPDAAIIQIGAVWFEPAGLKESGQWSVVPTTAIASGGQMDLSTIQWWMIQPKEIRDQVWSPESAVPVADALSHMFRFCQFYHLDTVWAHGSTFDIVILDQTARRLGKQTPWSFRDVRCMRTLLGQFTNEERMTLWREAEALYPNRHIAISDAARQAYMVVRAWELLGRSESISDFDS